MSAWLFPLFGLVLSFLFFLVLFFFRLPLFLLCIIVLFKFFKVEGRRKRATGTPESSASSDDEIVLFYKDIPGHYESKELLNYCTNTQLARRCAQHSGPRAGAAGRVLTQPATAPVRCRPTRGPTRAAAGRAGPPLADLGQRCNQSLPIAPASPRYSTTCRCVEDRSTIAEVGGFLAPFSYK